MITGAETSHLLGRPAPIFVEGRLPVLEAPLVRALGLHDGQVVRPTVEVRSEQLKLVLQSPGGPRVLDLPPGLRAAPGDMPSFKVQLMPEGQAVLRPLAIAPAGPSAAAADPASLASAMGRPDRLGRLSFRPPGMDTWLQLLRPGVLSGLLQAHPQPEANELVQRLLRQRPAMAQLSAEGLRQALLRAGLGGEALLARGQGPEIADFKIQLRQLMRTWTQAPASALALLGEALDDIEASQLRAVAGAADPQGAPETLAGRELNLSFVLPFSDADPVKVELHRQRRRPGEEAPPFFVHLHTQNRDIGEVWLQTRILNSHVEMVMWAVREDVAARAREGGSDLAEALGGVGLQMTAFRIIHGPRPSNDAQLASPGAGRLLDLKA